MKGKIKIKFVDFWPGFIPEKSYFFQLMGGTNNVELSESPDIIFFSNFGNEHKNYNCFRIFFSSENERANLFKSDIALTFDYSKSKRSFRLPLYVLFAFRYGYDPHNHRYDQNKTEILNHWKNRKFCCFVISNEFSKKRIDFFNFLNDREVVHSGGSVLNNIGAPIVSKIDFIKDFKFVISFENSAYPGYVTEKIFEPFLTKSIPVYWGDPKVNRDFNPDTFINIDNFKNYDEVYDLMKLIESDDELLRNYLFNPPIYIDNVFWKMENVRTWIFEKYLNTKTPVAKNKYFLFVSFVIDRYRILKYLLIQCTIGYHR